MHIQQYEAKCAGEQKYINLITKPNVMQNKMN